MRSIILIASLLLAPSAAAESFDFDATRVEATGDVGASSALAALLHEGEEIPGTTTLAFELTASSLRIERDHVPAVASTGIVVPMRGTERTEFGQHANATATGSVLQEGQFLAVVPTGPAWAELHARVLSASGAHGDLEIPQYVQGQREPFFANVDDAARLDARSGNLTIRGDFVMVFWEWELDVHGDDGEASYTSGRSVESQIGPGEGGEVSHVYAFVKDGELRMHLPAERPAGLYLESPRVAGVDRLHCLGTEGELAGETLDGRPLHITGSDLLVRLGTTSGGHLPVTVVGGIDEATVDGIAVLAAPTSTSSNDWFLLPVLLVPLVAAAVAAVALAGRRGPHHGRCLNLADRALDRKWGHLAAMWAWLHRRGHPGCPDGLRLHADACQIMGRTRKEIALREQVAPILHRTHRLHNAMRLVILHGLIDDVDGALAWLEKCHGMDKRSLETIERSQAASRLVRHDRFRQGVAELLGLHVLDA